MAKRGDHKYLDECAAYFTGWAHQVGEMLLECKDKLTSSQMKRFREMEKEIYESISFGVAERARARDKEEEEIKRNYKGAEANNRLLSLEMNSNLANGARRLEAGNKFKQLYKEIEMTVDIKSTPVSSTIKKLSSQKMKLSASQKK